LSSGSGQKISENLPKPLAILSQVWYNYVIESRITSIYTEKVSYMSTDTERTPITEEDLVEFLIDHDIQTAEELSEFTRFVRLLFLAFEPTEDVTWH
jgi:hypothetical protein